MLYLVEGFEVLKLSFIGDLVLPLLLLNSDVISVRPSFKFSNAISNISFG